MAEKKKRPVGAIIPAVLIALLTAALLELGKHALHGWLFAAASFCVFFLLRRRLAGKRWLVRLTAWIVLLVLLAAALAFSRPPYRAIPAVEGICSLSAISFMSFLASDIRSVR